jgi:hypothetical protein
MVAVEMFDIVVISGVADAVGEVCAVAGAGEDDAASAA